MKIALSAVSGLGGVSSTLTGLVIANVPAISEETPVSITLGLIFIGVAFTASAAWRISRVWARMENKVDILEKEVIRLKRERGKGKGEEDKDELSGY